MIKHKARLGECSIAREIQDKLQSAHVQEEEANESQQGHNQVELLSLDASPAVDDVSLGDDATIRGESHIIAVHEHRVEDNRTICWNSANRKTSWPQIALALRRLEFADLVYSFVFYKYLL